jgi:DNA (cytosine-5)-methyltransferase 1
MTNIRYIDLFAGVGGFRLGLEKASNKYQCVWSNQWEPSTKLQIASDIYTKRFGLENHSNIDIAKVSTNDIPICNLIVGGFPCQDYSVARTLNNSKGIEGKKGVLWWEIHRILKNKEIDYIFLENVDRLLKSPVKQRGKDFAIMLKSLSNLGYVVEWRVINASDYGFPQKRKRIYILGYKKNTKIVTKIHSNNLLDWITKKGTFANAFPIDKIIINKEFDIEGDLLQINDKFNINSKISPFEDAGIIFDNKVITIKTTPLYLDKKILLKDIIINEKDVPNEFFISEKEIEKWKFLKGSKKILKQSKDGFEYYYTEGSMAFPDDLNKSARTIITGEGGKSPSRFKHVIKTESGRYRRLTPLELERINMFPDNHTKEGTDIQRAFLMGNALVVGVIEKIGRSLIKLIL